MEERERETCLVDLGHFKYSEYALVYRIRLLAWTAFYIDPLRLSPNARPRPSPRMSQMTTRQNLSEID